MESPILSSPPHVSAGKNLNATGLAVILDGALNEPGHENVFRQVLNQLPVGVLLAEAPSGRVLFANERLCRMFKHLPEAFGTWEIYLGAQAFDMYGLPVLPGDFPLARTILCGDIVSNEQISIVSNAGEKRYFCFNSSPLRNAEGEIHAGLCTILDITDQVRSEAALRQSETRYQRAATAAKVGVWELDFTTGVLYIAPILKSILGFTNTEIPNTIETWISLVHPEDLAPSAYARDAYLTGSVDDYELEVRRRHKDGTYRWFLSRGTVVRDETGDPIGLVGSDTDITERKRAEASLRESEERLRLGLEAGNAGTWDWDIHADHIAWSRRTFEIHGVSPENWTGRLDQYLPLIHPEDRQRATLTVGESLEKGHNYDILYRIVRPSGEIRWVSTVGKPFFDDAGRPIRLLGASSDVTDRVIADAEREALLEGERAARSEIERASRLKDEFLATLSHELRTPLNSILGWASLLQRESLDPELRNEGLLSIERNAKGQAQIIEDLLDMSRILAGKLRLRIQPVDLNHILQAAVESVDVAAQARNIGILVAAESLQNPLWADATRLQQILWNLLANAVKFSPPDSKVFLSAAVADSEFGGNSVVFTIEDNGEGIPSEFLPYAFDRFRQADASTTRRHGGLGLGLSIVKHLVELHGGEITAESDGPGTGARFRFNLPLNYADIHLRDISKTSPIADPATPPEVLAVPQEIARPLLGTSVLVVEDERDLRELIGGLLGLAGATIHLASSADEARTFLAEESINIIVSDLSMPREDGFSFMRTLRQQDNQPRLPAIALSALSRAQDKERALEAGYDAHMVKPVEPAALVAAISRILRQ